MKRQWMVLILVALGGLIQAQPATGHALDQSNLFLTFEDTKVSGRVEITLRDLNTALDLDLPTGDSVTAADLDPYVGRIQAYVDERVSLTIAGRSDPLPFTDTGMLHLSFASYLQLNFAYEEFAEQVREVDVEYMLLFDKEPDHRGLLAIENNWQTGTFDNEAVVSLIFEPGLERQTLDLSDASTWRGFLAMVKLGTHHIWIGIDHILFLFALLLPAVVQRRENGRWKPVDRFSTAIIHVIKVVTVFTVAHTVTLSLAALNVVSLSSRLVESIIALSIAIAALNIVVPIFRDRIWVVVFAFGLFHGFGFASVLGEIGIPSNFLVHSLLGFNIGVEIGQVAIVILAFPILYLAGRSMFYSRFVLPAMTAGLIAVSLYWFTERAFLIDLPAGAIFNYIVALAG